MVIRREQEEVDFNDRSSQGLNEDKQVGEEDIEREIEHFEDTEEVNLDIFKGQYSMKELSEHDSIKIQLD